MESKDKGIGIIRVSSIGQYEAGDSPTDQREKIILKSAREQVQIVEWFEFAQSASGFIQPSAKCLDYLKQHPEIKFAIFMSIERFTRGGTKIYLDLRDEYRKLGVQLLDAEGIISRERYNTMERYGVSYRWSVSSPSDTAEIAKAQEAESGFRRIMTQMISGNWDACLEGFWIGPSPFGYQSKRIKVQEKKHRFILEPHETECIWFKKMFENKIKGLSDKKSVEEINNLGFKSREHRLRNGKIRGGLKLTTRQLSDYIQNPIYAGVMIRRMTKGKAVRGNLWTPIISIEDFNQANKDRLKIVEIDGEIKVIKKELPQWKLVKNRDNPEFPNKFILCPICRKPLQGSASTVPNEGRRNPAYHCTLRGHNFRVKKSTFDETLSSYIKRLKFRDDILLRLRVILLEEWEARRLDTKKESIYLQDRVLEIEAQQLQIAKNVSTLSIPALIIASEKEYQKLENEKIDLMDRRNEKEKEELDINKVIQKLWHFLNDFSIGLLGQSDPIEKARAFATIFDHAPTYEEIAHGTTRLKPYIELITTTDDPKNLSARPEGIEPPTLTLEPSCSIR